MDIKGPMNTAFEANQYKYVDFNLFSNYIVALPTPKNIAHYVVKAIFHHRNSHSDHLQNLTTVTKTDCLISEGPSCCTPCIFVISKKFTRSLDKWTC